MAASAARRCAFRVVRRVFDDGAYADRAFRSEADRARLDGRDRAFAQRLAYATVQRRATPDHLPARLPPPPPDQPDPPPLAPLRAGPPPGPRARPPPPLRDALRLGLAQLLLLDSVPAHAAVSETVELAKAEAGAGPAKLANAVMRRAAREAPARLELMGDATASQAATLHSHPLWVARMWWDALGPDEARGLMRHDNEPE